MAVLEEKLKSAEWFMGQIEHEAKKQKTMKTMAAFEKAGVDVQEVPVMREKMLRYKQRLQAILTTPVK